MEHISCLELLLFTCHAATEEQSPESNLFWNFSWHLQGGTMFVTFPFAFLHCSLFCFNVLIISSNLSDCEDTGVGHTCKFLPKTQMNGRLMSAVTRLNRIVRGLPIATRFTAFVPECSYMPCHHLASGIAPRHGEEVQIFGPFCITKRGAGSQRRRNCSLPKKVPSSRTFRTVARVYLVSGRRPWEAQVNDTYWSSAPFFLLRVKLVPEGLTFGCNFTNYVYPVTSKFMCGSDNAGTSMAKWLAGWLAFVCESESRAKMGSSAL